MHYYNTVRSHGGHCNKGLPPVPFAELYAKTPGDHLEKLISLGIVKLDDEWEVRMMGSNRRPAGVDPDDCPDYVDTDDKSLPFALVMERKRPSLELHPDLREPGPTAGAAPPPSDEGPASALVLAK